MSTTINTTCDHCGDTVITPYKNSGENANYTFCCQGCLTVFEIINSTGYSKYYDLKRGSTEKGSPVHLSNEKFTYLDQPDFLSKYAIAEDDKFKMQFFLEGIHCVACLWLVEKIPEMIPDVLQCSLNMGKSVVTVEIAGGSKFSIVANKLNQLGYKPHPITNDKEQVKLSESEDRSFLIKIGVAFACTGNIMLLSISTYAGASGPLLEQFKWYTLLLSMPVLLYSAIPFYQSAYFALINRKLSIDIPIVIAIILGTLSGIYNILTGGDHLYFDSLCSLIFLLLSARFLLKKSGQKSMNASEIASLFTNKVTHRYNSILGEYEEAHIKFLEKGDKVKVETNEMVPADGLLQSYSATLDCSLLTGESTPIEIKKDMLLSSGSLNIGPSFQMQVNNNFSESRLGKILSKVEQGWKQKSQIVSFTDIVAKYFVLTVFLVAIATFMGLYYSTQDFSEAFNRTLSFIIITCPCALGLTTPLALSLSLGRLSSMGIIVKNDQTLEKLSKAKKIFLDKTGTLTAGNFSIENINYMDQANEFHIDSIIYHLEHNANHPIAKSIINSLKAKYTGKQFPEPLNISNIKSITGRGVEGISGRNIYEIHALKQVESSYNEVGVFQNGRLIAKVTLRDKIRPESRSFIHSLKNAGLQVALLSGDRKEIVAEVAQKLDISEYYAEVSPEKKSEIIKSSPESIMVGDGANDALALSNSFVGIAVKGSVEVSLRACEVFISKSGLSSIRTLLAVSHNAIKLIKLNLKFSICYNLVGSVLAISGKIDPLWAAILMPLSSFTVILTTLLYGRNIKQSIIQNPDIDHKIFRKLPVS